MANIVNTLIKVKDQIKPLLIEIFPDCEEAINFQYEDNFQEWFGMLFKLEEWDLTMEEFWVQSLEMSESRIKKCKEELKSYEGLEDFGIISVVKMEHEYIGAVPLDDGYFHESPEMEIENHLVDGYHRVLIAKKRGLSKLKGCAWEKHPNDHPNCKKIKNLIINNL